jgi:hypothetical protein
MEESTADFLSNFDENVVENIDKVRRNVDAIEVLYRRILLAVRADDKASAESRLRDLVEENKRLSRKIQTTIKIEKAKIEDKTKR